MDHYGPVMPSAWELFLEPRELSGCVHKGDAVRLFLAPVTFHCLTCCHHPCNYTRQTREQWGQPLRGEHSPWVYACNRPPSRVPYLTARPICLERGHESALEMTWNTSQWPRRKPIMFLKQGGCFSSVFSLAEKIRWNYGLCCVGWKEIKGLILVNADHFLLDL